MTHVLIDPHSNSGNIKFHLNTDGTATGTSVHDSVVYSRWICNLDCRIII